MIVKNFSKNSLKNKFIVNLNMMVKEHKYIIIMVSLICLAEIFKIKIRNFKIYTKIY
jgi:hypothetical protein